MLARIRYQWSCLSSQQGSLLVEVMVGALVLGITTMAVLTGIDGAQDTGRKNKDRTEYSALAQQDIERLRSKPITSLSNYDETRTVRVGSVDYTVVSKTEWVRDASGVVSCTDDSTQAEYMKLSSTVWSPAGVNKAVTETTLLTPAPGAFSATTGTAAILLTDRDGQPIAGSTVTLSGPGTYSETTNSAGCAIFGYIPAGAYTAQVSGGVTWASQLPATAPAPVTANRTSLVAIEVEPPGSLRARFIDPVGAASTWSRITVAHAKLPAGFKVFPNSTATAKFGTLDATNLYPHHDAYGVYAGSCARNNPAFWDSDYFLPGGPGYIELDPGDNLKSVDVVTPTLTITLTKRTDSGTDFRVRIKQMDTGCTEELWNDNTASTAATQIKTFQLPFGRYKICVDDGHPSSPRHRISTAFNAVDAVDASTNTPSHHRLTPEPGVPLQQADAITLTGSSTSYSSGTCPAGY